MIFICKIYFIQASQEVAVYPQMMELVVFFIIIIFYFFFAHPNGGFGVLDRNHTWRPYY